MEQRLCLVPITTPAASPQSNGMAEAFVNTLRRDYIVGADLSAAEMVLDQVPGWIVDYNGIDDPLGTRLQISSAVPSRGLAGMLIR